ncbi:helix-turn-helix transcriptional regulator [Pararhodobacter sp. SW119]|uniref:helix-turn-helix domain-containing protein n=1 Tax=Pararhodobacter sp. SW119 TaxID=2780075 RepID=UPI001ADFF50E|nr:helix-turn-helix transcriptional regulator [Pararhodobacter sp. SW119]
MSESDTWYSETQATLGDRLAAAREAAGLSQSSLATRLGVRQKTLRSWESDLSEPRANRLQMLAAMLGVSLRWLLTGEGEGVDPPAPTDVSSDAALLQALSDLRTMRGELLKMTERMGQLEKRLRKQIETVDE